MTTVPIHLLWGPPRTGKTTTLGAAVAEWMKAKKRVLVVSTSNAAVDVAVKSILKRTPQPRRKDVLRLGTTLDKEVDEVTITGKLRSADYKTVANAREAQDKLSNLAAQLS